MQRPVRGYRGCSRPGSHLTHTPRPKDDEHNRLSLPNCVSDDLDDDQKENNSTIKSRTSSESSSITISTDLEAAIRSLRPLATSQQKNKAKPNISSQKANLPQLHMTDDVTIETNGQANDKQAQHWFPKLDAGHVDPADFIRHNHIDSQQVREPSKLPLQLTAIPPADISTRPTAIIAPAGPTRPTSEFFTSTSSIKQANSSLVKSNQPLRTSSLIHTAASAFHPINPQPNSLIHLTKMKSSPLLMDIPRHKALERGQKLTRVHISHPQSPSTIHLMLDEDFKRACSLLHKMAAHPELHSEYTSNSSFKPEINQICACLHEGRWFRCRVLQMSSDCATATVVYLDWGMTISVPIDWKHMRRLPDEFYIEPACAVICHLDGVYASNNSISSEITTQCITLLSEDEYEIIVNDYHTTTGGRILLFHKGRSINEPIQLLLTSNKVLSSEEEFVQQFQHQIQLSVGDEFKALLSSFSGKDDAFYVLLINDDTVVIDRAMSELQEDHIPNREYLQTPQIKTLVVARYADDGKYYRAWVKGVDMQKEQAWIFFVDFGNESRVAFSDIYMCPESVRDLPWLGIRVRLTGETMTNEELTKFWKLTESHYIWICIKEVLKDSYGIQIKIDYTVFLRHQRAKMSATKRVLNKNVQAKPDEQPPFPRHSSEKSACLLTPSLHDPSQPANENMLRSLVEMINNELRSLRHRINDSDDASQDRHSQLMQFLFSIANFNNSTQSKKTGS